MTVRRVKRDIRWKMAGYVFSLSLFLGIFALISLRTAIVNLTYEISSLESQREELVRTQRFLETEKARAYSVENIEMSAKKFGMDVIKRENIIYVRRVTGAAPYKASGKPIPWGN